jgi:hypothetical protein
VTLASTQETEALAVRDGQGIKRARDLADPETAQACEELRHTKTRLE